MDEHMGVKTCVCCGKRKRETSFTRDYRCISGYTNKCLKCKRAHDNDYYKKNEKRRKAVKARRKKIQDRNARYICRYLRGHPCVDCGEKDLVVLDFDHVRGTKRNKVTALILASFEALKAEIAKCEVRCANCHRRRTAQQFGWKYKMPRKHK